MIDKKYTEIEYAEMADKANEAGKLLQVVNEEFILIDPSEPTEEEKSEIRKAEIIAELAKIDQESIRPLRTIADGTATAEDKEKLVAMEKQAQALRAELMTKNDDA